MKTARRVLLRRGAAAMLTVCLHVARAGAQPVPLPDAPTSTALLPRYDWNLAAAHLAAGFVPDQPAGGCQGERMRRVPFHQHGP